MDPNRKITKNFTKKFDSKVIKRQYFHRKTGLKLGSTAVLDCLTGQNNGRYCEKELLLLLVLFPWAIWSCKLQNWVEF